jgi:hypothetical protein
VALGRAYGVRTERARLSASKVLDTPTFAALLLALPHPRASVLRMSAFLVPTPIVPFRALLALNGNRQRSDRRGGSAPELQRRGNEQELVHLIFR